MALTSSTMVGMAMRFVVAVDGIDLGGWSGCKGLNVEFKVKKIVSGGSYDHEIVLPDKAVTYGAVTLERVMTSADSAKVQSWLATKVDDFSPGTAQITLCDAAGKPVTTWSLRNVFPQKWAGPGLEAAGKKIATETLTLIHEGFL